MPSSKPLTFAIASSPLFAAVLAQFSVPVDDDSESIGAEAWVWTATRPGIARIAFTIEQPHPDGYGIEPGALLVQSAQAWIERQAALAGVPWRDAGFRFISSPDLNLPLLRLSLSAPGLVEAIELETACGELEDACAHAIERMGTVEVVE